MSPCAPSVLRNTSLSDWMLMQPKVSGNSMEFSIKGQIDGSNSYISASSGYSNRITING